MNRVQLVLGTAQASLWEFDHPPGEAHDDPHEERAAATSINFVEGGSFDVVMGHERWRLGPGSIFVTRAGMEFACRHDDECPTDRCLSVRYEERAVDELLTAGATVPALPSVAVSARQRYLRHRLRGVGAGDELRLELLAGALFEAATPLATPAARPVDIAATDVMRRIDRAIELMEAEHARELTLRELASAAGMSAYHFARVFRSLTGLPPHRYLTAVRLRHAARLLDAGASVTRASLDAGFGSLSHFVTAFRKRFGVLPSQVRDGARFPALVAASSTPLWRKPRRGN